MFRRSRKFLKRYNPCPPEVADLVPDLDYGKTFATIKDARNYLRDATRFSDAECKLKENQIIQAVKIVARAERRNCRRGWNRGRKKAHDRGETYVTYEQYIERERSEGRCLGTFTGASQETIRKYHKKQSKAAGKIVARGRIAKDKTPPQPPKQIYNWEEAMGPDGEVVRYKLDYKKDGTFWRRRRTREEPQIGDIVLDLREGINSWRITSNRRRKHPVTPAMRKSYENSSLYKVRQLAIGKLSLTKFIQEIQSIKKSESKKRKRKNKKK